MSKEMVVKQMQAIKEDAEKTLESYKRLMSDMGMYIEKPQNKFERERMEQYDQGVREIERNANKMVNYVIENSKEPDPDTITLKRIYSSHCQSCGTQYKPIEIVYFIPDENMLVCFDCAESYETTYEPRIYKEEE